MMTPTVSVVIPCRNEEKTIRQVLEALLAQTYPTDQMEVVIADGFSTDGTRGSIAQFTRDHPELEVVLVDNPRQIIPAGVNTAIKASRGEFIVRMDAHSLPSQPYVKRLVDALEKGLGENVGVVWDITPQNESLIARSIAAAAAHPLAVGDARYRFGTKAAYVDTVPFGAFRRSLIDQVGYLDESLLANEDYEFNTRIRQSGGRIWLDPGCRCVYFARKNLSELARQYWRYGFWKSQMLKRYPSTLRPRQALPPMFVVGLLVLLIAAFFWYPARILLLATIGIYLTIILGVALQIALKKRDFDYLAGVPLAIATMHFAWGAGFLAGLAINPKKDKQEKRNASKTSI